MNEVKLYTMKGCHFCDDMKKKLISENIEYKEIDIRDKDNQAEVKKLLDFSKAENAPIIVIGKTILVPMVSFNSVDDGVKIIKELSHI